MAFSFTSSFMGQVIVGGSVRLLKGILGFGGGIVCKLATIVALLAGYLFQLVLYILWGAGKLVFWAGACMGKAVKAIPWLVGMEGSGAGDSEPEVKRVDAETIVVEAEDPATQKEMTAPSSSAISMEERTRKMMTTLLIGREFRRFSLQMRELQMNKKVGDDNPFACCFYMIICAAVGVFLNWLR